jgi:hypothetical protein
VRFTIVLAAIALSTVLLAASSRAVEQTIEPLDPGVEQRVQVIGGGNETEQVRMVETQAVETVEPHVPPSPAAKAASTAGKVVLGVTGAAIALGAMAASLLFF